MAQQRQSFGPGRVLAQVTLIVALPLLGGVVAGLVVDGIAGTAPLFALGGMAIGTLVGILWLRSFITSNAARLRAGPSSATRTAGERQPGERRDDEQPRQESAERP
jgi:F0F1-type ATP synthase assembly protein I